jgi:hypothetical protein
MYSAIDRSIHSPQQWHDREVHLQGLGAPAHSSHWHGPGHYVQVSHEAAETATKVKGSWGSGTAEEHIAWVPIVSGLREYAEASSLAVMIVRV